MKIKLVRTMWGILDGTDPHPEQWEGVFQKIVSEGFEAIEFCAGPFNCFQADKARYHELVKKYNLTAIAQVHTCGYPIKTHKVEDHVNSFRDLVREAKQWDVCMVNAHSGTDTWTLEQNVQFMRECLKIEEEEKIPITHETHRKRVLYTPFATRDVLKQLPTLKVNADLSHWVVVCERIFTEECDSGWGWGDILAQLAAQCHLVHARVGYDEGPQIPDPRGPEWRTELEAHESWWSTIWRGMEARGLPIAFVEPEHGPAPYLHTLPFTKVPVTDLWEVNTFIGQRQKDNFNKLFK